MRQVQDYAGPFDITEGFREKFMELIELCTFSLMNGEDNFFALFMIQMQRAIKFDMPSATGISASISCFTVYFNPAIFLKCSLEEMKALIKHEVYHIMFSHLKRSDSIKKKYSALAVNKAMDITVNQYIRNLPAFMDTLQCVRLSYNADFKDDGTLEEYAEAIQKAIDRLKVKKGKEDISKQDMEWEYDSNHTHDIWDMSYKDLNFEQLGELTRKTANNANRGRLPAEIGTLLSVMNEKPEISWSQYLRKLIGTIPSGYRKTITRKDRRQPDRLDLRGKLSDHAANIVVALDISGSMTDTEIKQAMVEILTIIRNAATDITVIECDSQIRRIYRVRSDKDIRQKLDNRGGTRFSPVFKYLRENGMRNHLLIYFTDGLGEEQLEIVPSNYRTLWVLTGKGEKLSLARPYGEIKRLSNVKAQKCDFDYMKNEMRDILVEWQK